MITERDRKVLSWIEEYKAVSVSQADALFFNCYESCRRRLKQLEDMNLIKSYVSRTREKVYYQNKKLREHDLFVFDFIKKIKGMGADIRKIKIQPVFLNGIIKGDAYIEFIFNKNLYFVILEIDYTHYTDIRKMQLYEKFYRKGSMQRKCYGTFPIIIIARQNDKISEKYYSDNFDIIYTDLKFSHIEKYF